jgi:hypothetical protein
MLFLKGRHFKCTAFARGFAIVLSTTKRHESREEHHSARCSDWKGAPIPRSPLLGTKSGWRARRELFRASGDEYDRATDLDCLETAVRCYNLPEVGGGTLDTDAAAPVLQPASLVTSGRQSGSRNHGNGKLIPCSSQPLERMRLKWVEESAVGRREGIEHSIEIHLTSFAPLWSEDDER